LFTPDPKMTSIRCRPGLLPGVTGVLRPICPPPVQVDTSRHGALELILSYKTDRGVTAKIRVTWGEACNCYFRNLKLTSTFLRLRRTS
jgi:hypothetical protein